MKNNGADRLLNVQEAIIVDILHLVLLVGAHNDVQTNQIVNFDSLLNIISITAKYLFKKYYFSISYKIFNMKINYLMYYLYKYCCQNKGRAQFIIRI